MTLDITPRAALAIVAAVSLYCADAWVLLWVEWLR